MLKMFRGSKVLIKSTSVLLSSWSSCYGLQCRINNVHVIWKCSEWGPCGDGPLITHSWWQQCPRIGDVATPLPAQVSYFILIPNNFLWNIIVTYFLSPDVNPITHVKCEMWNVNLKCWNGHQNFNTIEIVIWKVIGTAIGCKRCYFNFGKLKVIINFLN